MADQSSDRLHALDAVRGFAMLAGIILHATMSFLPSPRGVPLWIVMDSHRSVALGVLFHIVHTSRMTVFFLIAGFFARLSLQRRGLRGFVIDRLKRIGIPLVVGWPILFAAVLAVSIWAAIQGAHGGPLPPPPKYAGFPAFPLTHLWFLYVLLLLYAAALSLHGIFDLLDHSGVLRNGVAQLLVGLVRSPFGLVALAAPTAAALYGMRSWLPWFGVPTPDSSLVPNIGAAAAFATAFGCGWLVHRRQDLLAVFKRWWPFNLALAICFTTAGLTLQGLAPALVPPPRLTWLALTALYPLSTWSWSFALIGCALHFLSGPSAERRYVADASYWLYLIHLPIIMALQTALAPLDWPWPVKFAVILGVALPSMFASYQVFVRYGVIGAVLGGKRLRRPVRTRVPFVVV